MKLWIVGINTSPAWKLPGDPVTWDFAGVFSTEELAVAACLTPSHFIGSAVLDEQVPMGPTAWPDCRYPFAAGDDFSIERSD